MNFGFRHHNRAKYPRRHILVCEDALEQQSRIAKHFSEVFESEGDVQFSFVPGSLHAAAIVAYTNVDLIILDHDMPQGNGEDLIRWLKNNNKHITVMTFSGLPQNNKHMMDLGAKHLFSKEEVVEGKADDIIRNHLREQQGADDMRADMEREAKATMEQ